MSSVVDEVKVSLPCVDRLLLLRIVVIRKNAPERDTVIDIWSYLVTHRFFLRPVVISHDVIATGYSYCPGHDNVYRALR